MAILDIQYGREILAAQDDESQFSQIKEMEMVLQNSSYGHEYAMIELADARDVLQQEEILNQLEEYKRAYFQARQYLSDHHPHRLQALEREISENKTHLFRSYQA